MCQLGSHYMFFQEFIHKYSGCPSLSKIQGISYCPGWSKIPQKIWIKKIVLKCNFLYEYVIKQKLLVNFDLFRFWSIKYHSKKYFSAGKEISCLYICTETVILILILYYWNTEPLEFPSIFIIPPSLFTNSWWSGCWTARTVYKGSIRWTRYSAQCIQENFAWLGGSDSVWSAFDCSSYSLSTTRGNILP